ncbi:PIN domain-containing protein [Polaribacter sp. Hel_I_88]|uniref:PIN domain-containing protein n=1 Tax=Polaribacter sp. Hel_I_88 TaxID=1250006 RepID=UPI00047B11C7|nr:PIN domain-containing protein [Polaribacter sp. Hel_I_88]
MIVITDSNILFSALISPNGTVAKVLKSKSNIQMFAPDFLFEEIENHLDKIVKYSKRSKKDIKAEILFFKEKLQIIHRKDIPKEDVQKAITIVNDIDIDDFLFVSLHFHTKHKLWTSDKELIKGLLKKGLDICITTTQLKKYLYK